MIVLVTGGRDFTNEAQLGADLKSLMPLGLSKVVHGDNPNGADALADLLGRQLLGDAGVRGMAADWSLGKRGGLVRNVEMLEEEKPDWVLGYPTPKSRGTWHCISEAVLRGIPVLAFIPWWNGDIAQCVEAATKPYGKVTGIQQGTHVVIKRLDGC